MNNKELEKKVKQFTSELAYQKGYVCSVDIFLKLGYLSEDDYQKWRFGKIEYLEKVCNINLHKLSEINKLIRKFSTEWHFDQSLTYYNRWGKGPKAKLIFSKSHDPKIENGYATHYLDKKRIEELKVLNLTKKNATNTQQGQLG
jgi:hypothetical protein